MLTLLDAQEWTTEEIFSALFPEKVDSGSRKPLTWSWMMSRIRDGQVRPPRNLIDLVTKSKIAQVRREDRNHLEYSPGRSLISSESIKDGLRALSAERVQDTLLAEAGDLAFRPRVPRRKAEHNTESLSVVLKMTGEPLDDVVQKLCSLGFLEKLAASYKVPSLYRDGLNITQGKAFSAPESSELEDDD